MKKLVFALILSVSVTPVMAEDTDQKLCSYIAKMAKDVMELRQLGVPLDEVLTIHERVAKKDDGVSDLFYSVIMDAYEFPSYQTPKIQQQTITEFANKVQLICLNAAKG